MASRSFQEFIAGTCWGCSPRNPDGLQIQSFWEGEEAVCTWQPKTIFVAGGNFLSGGILATVLDCHATCTAIAAAYRAEGRSMDSQPTLAFVSGSLHVDYLQPTPVDRPLLFRARVTEPGEKKIRVACEVFSGEQMTAKGEVLAVQIPAHLFG